MKALQGIRLLDLTHMLSGPYAGMMLADLGAETIKIEPPGTGEGTRKLLATDPKNSRHGMGAYFLTLNRNKKSVTLNLKSEAGLALFYELVKHADIVLDNFSAGVTERLRIDHARLAAINPRIITCTITGFGETGPGRDWPAFDIVAQAMGGGMSITGLPNGTPVRSGIPIGDLGGGLMGVVGVLAALVARQQTGRGQHVDISMLDAQISLLNYMATMYFLSGEVPGPLGNGHFVHVPYDCFPCSDGYVIIAVIVDEFWKNLMQIVDLPELDTEENRHQPGRWKNRALINQKLSERLRTNTQAYWLEKLRAARIPCAPVNNFAQALSNEQVLARGMVVEVEHPQGGCVKMPGNPVKLSEHEDTYSPPPLLGQHTEEVLKTLLGKTDEEIRELRLAGVI
ncbi:MAG: CoA transferase [Anaerolineales bacterium]|nr:CoA transferase [Anaerolineales bacterium]